MERVTLSAVAVTDTGRLRGHNEDIANVSEVRVSGVSYLLWLVADGMGGGIRGDEASALACDELLAALDDPLVTGQDQPVDALRDGVRRANVAVFERGTEDGSDISRMGTTLVAALLEPGSGRYWLVNVGDSRGYLIRDGVATQVTTDHSLVAEAAAAGLLTAEQARTSHRKNVITRAIGTEREVEPELLGPLELARDELLLLCSDGLHGMVDDTAIGKLAAAGSLRLAANALKDAANEAGGRDNITVLLGGWRNAEASQEASEATDEEALTKSPRSRGRTVRRAVAAVAVAGIVAATAALVLFLVL